MASLLCHIRERRPLRDPKSTVPPNGSPRKSRERKFKGCGMPPTRNGAALAASIVHKLFLFYAPKIAGDNRVPFAIAPNLKMPALQNVRTHQFGPDIGIEAYLRDVYKK